MYRYVVTAPGQGVQHPGMLDPWLDGVPGAHALVADWSRAAGFAWPRPAGTPNCWPTRPTRSR